MIDLTYCGSYRIPSGCDTHRHQHEWAQLEVIEHGTYTVLEPTGELTLKAGDAVLIPPGVEHGWGRARNVHALTFRYITSGSPIGYPKGAITVKSLHDDAWLSVLPRRVCQMWRSRNAKIQESSHLLFKALIAILTAEAEESVSPGLNENWTCLIEELHHIEHPPLKIEEMARRVYLSPSHFRRLFLQHFGTSPGQFQREARLRRAAELLQYTDISISQVARQLDYSDLASFSKAFVKQHGYRPSKLRR